ncbi:MAG: TIGR03086 family metal-binding protein [Actinomycetota bacterium]
MSDNAPNETSDLPLFPATAPAVFSDAEVSSELFGDVLDGLAAVIDVDSADLGRATPCADYDLGQLRTHVLGWLRFMATALQDPSALGGRPDPEAFSLAPGERASAVVEQALDDIQKAIASGVAAQEVTMSEARMTGDAVLAMCLGEYIIHAWDLATATGRDYAMTDAAVAPAHEFLRGIVAPEYRGPDSGFFGHEVEVAADVTPLTSLLGFAGRDPSWTPAA